MKFPLPTFSRTIFFLTRVHSNKRHNSEIENSFQFASEVLRKKKKREAVKRQWLNGKERAASTLVS